MKILPVNLKYKYIFNMEAYNRIQHPRDRIHTRREKYSGRCAFNIFQQREYKSTNKLNYLRETMI